MIRERNVHASFLAQKGRDLDGRIHQCKLNRRAFFEEFNMPLLAAKAQGAGAATGATGDTNIIRLGENTFEYHIKGTQTIVCPAMTATGLDIGAMDQTAGDGIEIRPGILGASRRRAVFLAGTDAFYVRLKAKLEDASGCNPFLVGLAKCEAYQATAAAYADYAWLGCIGTANPNTIKTSTEVAGGGNTDTDTLLTWADGATKTLEIRVGTNRVASYYVDGVQTQTAVAYTFTTGLFITPAIFFLQSADISANVELIEWEAGLLDPHHAPL
jgi:hypothetical protein